MPDISMCMASQGKEFLCPMRQECYRFKAIPSEYRQSYFMDAPFIKIHDSVTCEYFWPVESKSRFKRLEAQTSMGGSLNHD